MRAGILFWLALLLIAGGDRPLAAEPSLPQSASRAAPEAESRWLLMPLVSSDPKVSTAAGAMAAYLHRFDADSPTSKLFLGGSYSTTHSYRYGVGGKAYFEHDRQRLSGVMGWGRIRNHYSDFLGSGLPLQSTDQLQMLALRYTHAVGHHWFAGAQLVSTNYLIGADDLLAGKILEKIGLTGFKSTGVGLVAEYDTRDNQNSATAGRYLLLHQIAYRQRLGGDVSFDAYQLDFRQFMSPAPRMTLALQMKGRWSFHAPPAGFSSVNLRGYVRGQQIGQHMSHVAIDLRYQLRERWFVAGFAGVAALYGDNAVHRRQLQWYPNLGVGIAYQLNRDKMVLRSDIALGSGGARGFYLRFGQPF